jgi:TolB protein
VSDNPADSGLFTISPSGEGLRRVTGGEAHNPACSPSGEAVAFESNRAGVSRIYTERLSGSETPVPVTAGSGGDQLATWNPNGKAIAFARARTSSTAIFTIDLASHQEHQLSPGTGGDWRMSYSPDGTQIVFTSTRTGNNELWLMNADGTNARQLTHGAGDKRDPAWSPDGTWIVFRSDRDGHHWDIYKASSTDGHIVRLTSDSSDKGFPNWSPDSHWILFVVNRSNVGQVYVMPATGGDWTPITSSPTIGGGATWCR